MGCILDACDEMCKSCKEKTNLCGPGRCPVADRVIERLEQKILVEEPAVRALVARLAEKDARIAVLEKLLKETPVGDLDLATSLLVEKQHTMEYVAKLEGVLRGFLEDYCRGCCYKQAEGECYKACRGQRLKQALHGGKEDGQGE